MSASPAIAVTKREVYGNVVYYPASFEAEQFAAIAGTKTITAEALAKVAALGFKVIVVADGGVPIGRWSPEGVQYPAFTDKPAITMERVLDICLGEKGNNAQVQNAQRTTAARVLAEGWMQRNHPDSPGVTITDSQMADAAYAVRATIAKATGERT